MQIFTEAMQLPAERRGAYLERAFAGDGELRRRVEGLLQADEKAGQFLKQSPHQTASGGRSETPVGEKPGDCIGLTSCCNKSGRAAVAWFLWPNRKSRYGVELP